MGEVAVGVDNLVVLDSIGKGDAMVRLAPYASASRGQGLLKKFFQVF